MAEYPKKHPGGRPTKYRAQYARQAKKLVEQGATDWEMAQFFEVTRSTFYLWASQYKQFSDALKVAKVIPDQRVERTLYERAMGYSFESEKVFQHQGEIIRAKIVEHVPPDTTAQIFWLKNRRPKDWRDKHEVDNTGEITHKWDEATDDELERAIKARQDSLSGDDGRA